MDNDSKGWWSRHFWTIAVLLLAFSLAFLIRTEFVYPILQQFGNLYVYAGGSDSYYHSRVMQYIILNHTNLIVDPLLKYPVGAINPREPLFDWMNAILGILFAPFFGGNAQEAGAFFLNLQSPLWAALSVFPIYLIGREVGDRRTGLIAAMIFPFLPASISESIWGYADYLSFYTFIILVLIYCYIRTVKSVGSRRWVESYRSPRSIYSGLVGFLRGERTAVKWAVFTGVTFGALALAWQGYTYGVAVIGVFLVLMVLIERVRRVDSFGLYVATAIVGLVGFPMAMPYYYVQGDFISWFDLPLLLFFGALIILIPFMMMRDLPWVVSIPTFVALVVAAMAALLVVDPAYFTAIVTGQGYFIKTLIYSTVAEDVSPSFDTLVIAFGVITFFLAFVGLALIAWALAKGRFRQRWLLVILIFGVLSVYLPISASKFLLLASPAFALLPAEAVRRLWDLGSYSELRQSMRSLTDTRSRLTAFRKSFKAHHILIILLVVGLLVPNVWYGIDAGIPSNTKAAASTQVYDTLPSWLRPAASDASSFYFGATGASLDTPNLYDSAGYNWLAQQQTAIPEPNRSAVVAWWDYGFQTIDQGQHPSVADDFQNGIDPSGQFLLAQNQSIAIGVLTATLLNGEQTKSGLPYLPIALNQMLASAGLNLSYLHNALVNWSWDYKTVVANPGLYLPVDASTLTPENAMFMVVSYYIAGALSPNGVTQIYNNVQQYTGWTIRYAMTDTRLIPFSGSDTGIYYAPADLTGRALDAGGNPGIYFNVTVLGSNGKYYPEGEVPAGVSAVNYYISYFAPFYNSMIYRIYFGYNGTQVGKSTGIPGLEGSVASDPVMPGWMMSHFEVQYQTAYYCDNASRASNSNCYVAMNKPQAEALAASGIGVANTSANDYFSGGESILVYYSGETMTGTVTLPNGAPVAGARVTVNDEFGIPHMSVITGPQGQYSVILPPGNDTVNVTIGTLNGITQQGSILLDSIPISVSNAVGFSLQPITVQRTITVGASVVDGIVYWNLANSTVYQTSDLPVPDARVVLYGVANGSAITATTDAGGTFRLSNVAPGVYNESVLYDGTNYTLPGNITVDSSLSPVNASFGLTPGNITGRVTNAIGDVIQGATVTIGSSTGRVLTTTTNLTGTYDVPNLSPGNYTITAIGPGANMRSLGTTTVISEIGAKLSINLTEYPSAPATLTVSAGGAPVANTPIRLTPLPNFGNSASVASLSSALENSTVLYTNSVGSASAYLPLGNYTAYASTYVGAKLETALGTFRVGSPGAPVTVPTLELAPANWLTGTISDSAVGAGASSVVFAYNTQGKVVAVATNGSFSLALPSGTYSLLTLQAGSSTSPSLDAALQSVAVSGPTSVTVTPVTAVRTTFTVSTTLPSGVLYPAANANVTIRIGISGGPSIPVVTGSSGSVSYVVPAALPGNETYCLGASAVGYSPASECIAPGSLPSVSRLPISFAPVTLTLPISGTTSSTLTTIYLNGTSATAGTYVAQGYASASLTITPGTYSVQAYAPSEPNVTRYSSAPGGSFSVALGLSQVTQAVSLVRERNTTGTLRLPIGMPSSAVTMRLTGSTGFNLTVSGTAYTRGFYAPVGSYSAYFFGRYAGLNYTNLTVITVPTTGSISTPLRLSLVGVTVSGSLMTATDVPIIANTTVTFTTASGAVAAARTAYGNYTLVLAASTTYSVSARTIGTVVGPNGSYAVSYATATGANTCALGRTGATCNVRMIGATQLVWFNGTVAAPGLASATLYLEGPYPSYALSTVSVVNGRFSVQLLPGAYAVYANATGAAELTGVTVLPHSGPFALTLSPSYPNEITPMPPGGIVNGSVALVTVRSAAGVTFEFPNVVVGSTLSVWLPTGGYVLGARATGYPYSVLSNATASQSVAVVSGSTATRLSLAWVLLPSVAGTVSGPTSVDLPANGGPVDFSVGLTNTGNVPVTVSLTASPAYWNMTTTLTNVSLSPGATASGAVRVIIPAGTAVTHPPLYLTVVTANGTAIGTITDTPTIHIAPRYAMVLESSATTPSVGPHQVEILFSVDNTGNAAIGLRLSVVDAPQLASLGWTSNILQGRTVVTTYSVSPGASEAFALNLTSGAIAVPPTTAEVAVTILNESLNSQQTLTFSIPSATVTVNPYTVVTGPGTGTAPVVYAEWLLIVLVLVPALVVGAIVLVWRWNRTRRWRRW